MLVGGVVILIVAYAFRDIYNYLYTLALRVLNPVLYFAVAGILGCNIRTYGILCFKCMEEWI